MNYLDAVGLIVICVASSSLVLLVTIRNVRVPGVWMKRRTLLLIGLLCACSGPPPEGQNPTTTEVTEEEAAAEALEEYVFSRSTADFPEIRKTGRFRVGIPYSRTNFFFEKDRFRGFEYELFHELEKQLNKSRLKGEPSLTMIFDLIPVAGLIDAVNEGTVDVAGGSQTPWKRWILIACGHSSPSLRSKARCT